LEKNDEREIEKRFFDGSSKPLSGRQRFHSGGSPQMHEEKMRIM
jgi:hypothetical protein